MKFFRWLFNKRLETKDQTSLEGINAQRYRWENLKSDIDLRRPSWKKSEYLARINVADVINKQEEEKIFKEIKIRDIVRNRISNMVEEIILVLK